MAGFDSRASRDREPVRFLVFSASLRTDSLNARLARLAVSTIEANGGTVDFRPMSDFDTPSYNSDVQDQDGFPPGADQFRECVQTNDAFVISSPE
jgi:chromate reductase